MERDYYEAAYQAALAGFMSAAANRRTDEFGGSFTNRMRFCRLIVENVRKKVGDDYPLSFLKSEILLRIRIS